MTEAGHRHGTTVAGIAGMMTPGIGAALGTIVAIILGTHLGTMASIDPGTVVTIIMVRAIITQGGEVVATMPRAPFAGLPTSRDARLAVDVATILQTGRLVPHAPSAPRAVLRRSAAAVVSVAVVVLVADALVAVVAARLVDADSCV